MTPAQTFDKVEISPPSFLLSKKLALIGAKIFTPEKVELAQKVIESFSGPMLNEATFRIKEISRLARDRIKGTRDEIWLHAHELRGISGTAGCKHLGLLSNLLCHYLDGTDNDFEPDPNLITTVTVAALFTLTPDCENDPMVEPMLLDCSRAVEAQRKREGRSAIEA